MTLPIFVFTVFTSKREWREGEVQSWCEFSRVIWASLVAQMVKNLPAMQETQVRSLGQENPLEKGMATHSSILDWRIPWTVPMGSQRAGHG